jgi:protein phosphatase PTC6
MTENHRAEGRLESVRLRRMMGTGVIADSFGDSRYVYSVSTECVCRLAGRWMGALENTRRCVRCLADILVWTSAHQLTVWET